jgi:hypothetical protein
VRSRTHQTATPEALKSAGSSIVGSISTTTLTVTTLTSGLIEIGQRVTASGVSNNTTITAFVSGTNGGVGTYTLSQSSTVAVGTTMTTSIVVADNERAAYAAAAANAVTNVNAMPPIGQATLENVSVGTRTTAWNATITHTVTLTFASADAMRWYFNAGNSFKFSASRSGGTAGIKNTSWDTMFANMGTISFNQTNTTSTGNGTSYAIGYSLLTITDQAIFLKNTETPTYSPNEYRVYARANAALATATQIIFTINFADLSTDSLPLNPPFFIDENVDGTIVSTVQTYRSTGTNVATPAATVAATFDGGTVI